MKKQFLSYALLSAVPSLFLSVAPVQAQYLIEFTDGRQMTVRSYTEKGPTVTVYMSSGSIAFRKDDVKQIVALGERARVSEDQPPKTASLLDRYQTDSSVVSTPEADSAPSAVEKKPVVQKTPKEPTATKKLGNALQGTQLWNVLQPVSDRLFQLRYIVGLLVFGKFLKMFLLASAK